MNKVTLTLALITIVSLMLLVPLMADGTTKQCYICKQQVEDKDICLDGTISAPAMITTKEHIYICYSCLSQASEFGKTIVVNIDGIDLPNISKWSIDKDFVNPQSVIK